MGPDLAELDLKVEQVSPSILRVKVGAPGRWEVPKSIFHNTVSPPAGAASADADYTVGGGGGGTVGREGVAGRVGPARLPVRQPRHSPTSPPLQVTGDPFGFVVKRKKDKTVLFDSTGQRFVFKASGCGRVVGWVGRAGHGRAADALGAGGRIKAATAGPGALWTTTAKKEGDCRKHTVQEAVLGGGQAARDWSRRPVGTHGHRPPPLPTTNRPHPQHPHPPPPTHLQDQYMEISTSLPKSAALYGLGEATSTTGIEIQRDGKPHTLWNHDSPAAWPGPNMYGSWPIIMDVRDGQWCLICRGEGVSKLGPRAG